MIYDIIVDTLFEENLQGAIEAIGSGRIIMDKDSPEFPYLTPEEGYLVVRIKAEDPYQYARELERRTSQMRIVKVVERRAKSKE